MGFVSGNGSVVRYEVSSAQFGCKREQKTRLTGVLCGLHSAYAPYVCVYSEHTVKTVCQYSARAAEESTKVITLMTMTNVEKQIIARIRCQHLPVRVS